MSKNKWIILIVVVSAAILAAVFLIWWFTKEEKAPEPVITKTPEEIMKEEVVESIESYDFSKRDFELIEQIKTLENKEIPIVAELIQSKDKKQRYLGYVSFSGLILENPELKQNSLPALKKGLKDSDASIRVQVAQLLLNLKDKDGFPVLLNSLNSEEMMVPSEPVMTISDYSYLMLLEYTDVDYVKDMEKWQNWWQSNKNILAWDEENEKFDILK